MRHFRLDEKSDRHLFVGKGKKKNPWETDSEESSDDDDEDDFGEVVPSRDRSPRRAATAASKKYVFEDDSEQSEAEEIFQDIDHGQGDRDIITESPKKAIVISDVSDAESLPLEPTKSDSSS